MQRMARALVQGMDDLWPPVGVHGEDGNPGTTTRVGEDDSYEQREKRPKGRNEVVIAFTTISRWTGQTRYVLPERKGHAQDQHEHHDKVKPQMQRHQPSS